MRLGSCVRASSSPTRHLQRDDLLLKTSAFRPLPTIDTTATQKVLYRHYKREERSMRSRSRYHFATITTLTLLVFALAIVSAQAQVKTRLSIATGGTGGVYYPLGGGLAALMSKYLPGVEATAEVTTASVDNMKLLHANKVAVAFTLPDSAWDAYQGHLKGLNEKVAVRSLAALYSNFMHIVALDGTGIKGIPDLKGKRVSTGAPGSGTEIK